MPPGTPSAAAPHLSVGEPRHSADQGVRQAGGPVGADDDLGVGPVTAKVGVYVEHADQVQGLARRPGALAEECGKIRPAAGRYRRLDRRLVDADLDPNS